MKSVQCAMMMTLGMKVPNVTLWNIMLQGRMRRMMNLVLIANFWGDDIVGQEFKSGRQWLVILPEMSETQYPFRIQRYDNHGFISHQVYSSLSDAMCELASGDIQPDAGALARLSCTAEWALGCFKSALLLRVNSGSLGMKEADHLLVEKAATLGL